ncbi:hypothetical protein ZWY2020_013412 [Hordeum vulgare]|nr:hypothetical protein ZWY2020_013412 [Hordeum vulgare]
MGYREMQALARARGLNANGGKKDVLHRLLSSPATSVVDCGIQDKKEVAEDDDGKVEELKKENIVTYVILDAAQLQCMSYRELQDLAKARGLASNGIKKDVIEGLLLTPVNSAAVADGGFQDKKKLAKGGVGEIEEEVKKEKIVKVTKKGVAVLDEHILDDIKMTYHVLQVGLPALRKEGEWRATPAWERPELCVGEREEGGCAEEEWTGGRGCAPRDGAIEAEGSGRGGAENVTVSSYGFFG